MRLIRTRTYCDVCESSCGGCVCCTALVESMEIRKGDIFQSDCQAICNATNTQGVMGAGLAKLFKTRYPQMNRDYTTHYKAGKLRIGTMHVWRNPKGNPDYIINFPTKDAIYEPSQLVYIERGLVDLKRVIFEKDITSIALPGLGCGLGGLAFDDVKELLEQFASDLPAEVKVVVYEPL